MEKYFTNVSVKMGKPLNDWLNQKSKKTGVAKSAIVVMELQRIMEAEAEKEQKNN